MLISTNVIELEETFGILYHLYQRKASSLLTEYKKKEGKEKYPVKNYMQKYLRHNNLIRYIRDLNRLGHLYAKSIINEKVYN